MVLYKSLNKFACLILALCCLSIGQVVYGYEGGSLRNHGHTSAAGDGGSLTNLTVSGTVNLGGAGSQVLISSNAILPNATFYSNAPIVISTFVAFTTGTGILGTTTNNDAAVGTYQEFTSSSTSASVNCPATTTTFGDLGSVTLTAGDWEVLAIVSFNLNGATTTAELMGIGTVAGNSGTGLSVDTQFSVLPPTAASDATGIVKVRKSLSATTTFFLKYDCVYSAGIPKASGTISARRVR